jgi:DNA-binding FrmR family transcriptional regulator
MSEPSALPKYPLPAEAQQALLHRVHRLEGQVHGLARMVEEKRDCQEVLRLIAAIRSAVQSLGTLVLTHYLWECLYGQAGLSSEEAYAATRRLLVRLLR